VDRPIPFIFVEVGMSLITSYPAWYVLFCLAAGAVYTILLYRKEPLLNDLSVWLRRALVAFRFLTVSALAFLLLGRCCARLAGKWKNRL
jgi:hypothetical protein